MPTIDLTNLTDDEARVASTAVAGYRRERARVAAQAAFFDEVVRRYNQRPFIRMTPGQPPLMIFGHGAGRVEEPMDDALECLWRAWVEHK